MNYDEIISQITALQDKLEALGYKSYLLELDTNAVRVQVLEDRPDADVDEVDNAIEEAWDEITGQATSDINDIVEDVVEFRLEDE